MQIASHKFKNNLAVKKIVREKYTLCLVFITF